LTTQTHFINCSPSESAIFDHKYPGGDNIVSMEIQGQLSKPVAQNTTVVVVGIHTGAVYFDPRAGSCATSW
jgi:hypothetical protein